MLISVNRKQVMVHENPMRLSAESSDLGLPPGHWPDFIAVTDDSDAGLLFKKMRPISNGEDFGGFEYQSKDLILSVFND